MMKRAMTFIKNKTTICVSCVFWLLGLVLVIGGASVQAQVHAMPRQPVTELDRRGSIPQSPRLMPEDLACELPLLWEAHVNMGYAHTPLIVTPDRVYTSTDRVSALDRKTGEVLWEFTPEGSFTHGDAFNASGTTVLALDGNVLYFAGWQKALYALNIETGEALWRVALDNFAMEAIEFDRDRVYISTPRKVYVVDKKTGELVWGADVPETGVNYAPVLLVNENLLLLQSNKVLYAVKPATGEVIWQYEQSDPYYDPIEEPTSPHFMYGSRPHVVGNQVILQSIRNRLDSVDLRTGQRLWVLDNVPLVFGLPYMGNTPDGKVILADGFSAALLNPEIPKIDWWFSTHLTGAGVRRPVALTGDLFIFAGGDYLYALDYRKGIEVFRYAYDRKNREEAYTIVIDAGEVYYTSGNGRVYARKLECPQLEGVDIEGK